MTEEARRVGEPEKRLPRTEWAGMTDRLGSGLGETK